MRRSWVIVPAFATATALVACGSSHPPADNSVRAAPSPTVSPVATGPAPTSGLAVDSYSLQPGGGYPQPFSGPLTSVTRRATARDAVQLRLFTSTPTTAPSCDPYTSSCVPTWCESTGLVVVELSTEAIAAREDASLIGVAPGSHLSLLQNSREGSNEGAPLQVAMARTASGVDHVVLTTATGSDSMHPVKGLVALAVPGDDTSGTLTAYDPAGRVLSELPVPAPPTSQTAACAAQPMKLPKPGVQPADPAAAEKQVRAAYATAFTHGNPGDAPYASLAGVQNGETLHDAVDQVARNFPQASATITVTTGELVFTSPTTAYVQFTPRYQQGAPYGTQNGGAVFEDGKWLVSESTYCALMRFGGATCP